MSMSKCRHPMLGGNFQMVNDNDCRSGFPAAQHLINTGRFSRFVVHRYQLLLISTGVGLQLIALRQVKSLRSQMCCPAQAAIPTTVLRRISFGLTGLPPTTEEVSQLSAVSNTADVDQYLADAIDQRLASVQYGEQWARHWMDLARYADSAGYELDYPFRHSWRYRDWLIRSFQANTPLDRFLQEQLAGDQLWPDSEDARDGVLFLAIGPRRFEGGIQRPNEREYEWFTDLVDTTGSAFLGLTLGCSRCHDHKFDALTQRDYFGLQAIFGESRLEETRVENKGENSPVVLRVAHRDQPASLQILRRGEIEHPIGAAVPWLPSVLPGGGAIDLNNHPQQRAAATRWMTSAEQPLTARVMVNRVWLWHFGKGLVRTPNDFGVQGERPTHPELLDWLASELIQSGWDLNHLHRLILEFGHVSDVEHRQSRSPGPRSRKPHVDTFPPTTIAGRRTAGFVAFCVRQAQSGTIWRSRRSSPGRLGPGSASQRQLAADRRRIRGATARSVYGGPSIDEAAVL